MSDSRNQLAEQMFFFAAVTWEQFLHDLFVTYVNNDPEQVRGSLLKDVRDLAEKRLGKDVASRIGIDLDQLNMQQAAAILDKDGRNLTFRNSKELVIAAERWLVTKRSRRFSSMSDGDRCMLDAVVAIRNYVAHRSQASEDGMNECLVKDQVPSSLKRGKQRVVDVGSFLSSKPDGDGAIRLLLVLDFLESIAKSL